MVYNSSIGLEGTLLGVPVLCGGRARYTQYATVFLPETAEAYRRTADEFLRVQEIDVPPEFKVNARKFLYYQFFKVSLSFKQFLKTHPTPGYVQLKHFSWQDLLLENSTVAKVLVNGIMQGDAFLLPEGE